MIKHYSSATTHLPVVNIYLYATDDELHRVSIPIEQHENADE